MDIEKIKQNYVKKRIKEMKIAPKYVTNYNFYFDEILIPDEIKKEDNRLLEKLTTDKEISFYEYSTLYPNYDCLKNPFERKVLYYIKEK